MPPRPILFIDVDGVLNPFAIRRGVVPPGFEEHAILGYRVLLSRRHGDLLVGLADRYELMWATTWEADAKREIGPRVGLPELPYLIFGDVEPRGAWKTPAIDAAARGRPLAWIDDDIGRDAQAWADARAAPTLLLRADPGVGLVRRHIDALERFAARLAAHAR